MEYPTDSPAPWAGSLDLLSEGVAMVGADGVILDANRALCVMLGIPAQQIVGASAYDPPWHFESTTAGELAASDTQVVTALHGHHQPEQTLLLHGVGQSRWVNVRVSSTEPGSGSVVMVLEEHARTFSTHPGQHTPVRTDPLTSLVTREHVIGVLERALEDAGEPDERVGVLQVDLDGFRTINDTFGTDVGDAVLVEIAARLRRHGTEPTRVGRIGVDEFLLVLSERSSGLAFDTAIRELADRVRTSITEPVLVEGLELHLTASVGAARGPDDGTTTAALLTAADKAVRASREMGRNQFRFHDGTIDIRNQGRLQLDQDLRLATARRELEVHYQPIVELATGRLVGAEALVRWHHDSLGPIPPSQFIPTAEATGSIAAISDFVLGTLAEDMTYWDTLGVLTPAMRVSVNISASEFNRPDLLTRLERIVRDTGIDPARIELEITESLLVDDLGAASRRLRALEEMGFHTAIDDFGTGYSSLSYLHELPLHTLKVDRRFLAGLSSRDVSGRSGAITRTIISLARNLGVVTVAEGVENPDQLNFLVESGCPRGQGYLFAPALPRAAFTGYVVDLADATSVA
ncbi:MAG: EAL domain-containing protein [Microthrixaceae bacterium]